MDFVGVFFAALFSRWLSPRPSIRREGDRLLLSSTWRTTLLTLGAMSRAVVVDPKLRTVRIARRNFWAFYSSRRIEFEWIREIIYTYRDLMDSDWISHTEQDVFTVGLWLKNDDVIPLFRFYGEGDYINNSIWPDWMQWEGYLDAAITRGPQGAQSQQLADVLSGLIGVPNGNGPDR